MTGRSSPSRGPPARIGSGTSTSSRRRATSRPPTASPPRSNASWRSPWSTRRARRRMTLVSSFRSADMDPARGGGDGVRLLRAYLQYAESGGTSLGTTTPDKPRLGAFETDVRDRLLAAGIPVTAQYGVAGYFVD